ncbi:ECF-type sigma factor [Pseudanabaena sp. CCNP1317]|uniref:ECF-type sigma factor n=1 Tax=Pseudanabaena sp. CCNP1317 TaxID=3110253 RepID=UPI002B1FE90C|nr:ECF-type sigma factor [Pseudanabaena sp. CCNP1317]MEA5486598.1 ECF-type sigma factor [Pseudanabaena sp. CCNP1317]
MDKDPGSITKAVNTLGTVSGGSADEAAINLLYEELRRLSASAVRHERVEYGVLTTDILHKAFERLFLRPRAQGKPVHWKDRHEFYGAAAQTVRRILIEEARKRLAIKRGGGIRHVPIENIRDALAAPPDFLLRLDEELAALRTLNDRAARVVELRFFGGYSSEEIAEALGVSARTVRRDWDIARLWLYRRIRDEDTGEYAALAEGEDAPEERA